MDKSDKNDWLPEDGMVDIDDGFKRLHKLSIRNRELLKVEGGGCCFSCFEYVAYIPDGPTGSYGIKDWTDNGQTAICPCCGIDSILPGILKPALLQEMYNQYFTE